MKSNGKLLNGTNLAYSSSSNLRHFVITPQKRAIKVQ